MRTVHQERRRISIHRRCLCNNPDGVQGGAFEYELTAIEAGENDRALVDPL